MNYYRKPCPRTFADTRLYISDLLHVVQQRRKQHTCILQSSKVSEMPAKRTNFVHHRPPLYIRLGPISLTSCRVREQYYFILYHIACTTSRMSLHCTSFWNLVLCFPSIHMKCKARFKLKHKNCHSQTSTYRLQVCLCTKITTAAQVWMDL